jgi:mRNA-degrading endonuclease RelE of RelBE toxin-antitoxin system
MNDENNRIKLIGLGVLLTPDPLIYMRFTNSVFLKNIRYFLFKKTITLWDSLTDTVKEDLWIPKSTLAFKDFALADLNKALLSVKDIEFRLIMEINELSIIEFTDFEHEIERINI